MSLIQWHAGLKRGNLLGFETSKGIIAFFTYIKSCRTRSFFDVIHTSLLVLFVMFWLSTIECVSWLFSEWHFRAKEAVLTCKWSSWVKLLVSRVVGDYISCWSWGDSIIVFGVLKWSRFLHSQIGLKKVRLKCKKLKNLPICPTMLTILCSTYSSHLNMVVESARLSQGTIQVSFVL